MHRPSTPWPSWPHLHTAVRELFCRGNPRVKSDPTYFYSFFVLRFILCLSGPVCQSVNLEVNRGVRGGGVVFSEVRQGDRQFEGSILTFHTSLTSERTGKKKLRTHCVKRLGSQYYHYPSSCYCQVTMARTHARTHTHTRHRALRECMCPGDMKLYTCCCLLEQVTAFCDATAHC